MLDMGRSMSERIVIWCRSSDVVKASASDQQCAYCIIKPSVHTCSSWNDICSPYIWKWNIVYYQRSPRDDDTPEFVNYQ